MQLCLACRPETHAWPAGQVSFVGGLALQLLLAAAAKWRAEGHQFTCQPMSPAFTDDVTRLGVDPKEFQEDQGSCR
uniref:OrfX protein n=1 Tax=Cereibacter sphaeroides TaxID=1063 RepID=Q53133_CERSP|nr:orfX [Cereibacter sphaeroides]